VYAVIPVHNELDQLPRTVAALQGQTRPPDEIFILIDNHTDRDLSNAIAARVLPMGVSVVQMAHNLHRKAGNLNTGLSMILPRCEDEDVIAGFDADSVPENSFIEKAIGYLEQGYGAVGATFHGRPGGGLLGQLQRAEFARFALHQSRRPRADVLSGTGWMSRVCAMWSVAARRADGMVYDVNSIVEDFELTLAYKRLGIPVIAPAECKVMTDVMEKMRDWVSQRLRWQHGTLDELIRYGWARETRGMITRQAATYLGMIALPLTVVYMTWSFMLFGIQGINPLNAKLYALCILAIVAEQAWQARKAGPWVVIGTLTLVPELFYSIARQGVYVRAMYRLARKRGSTWGAGTEI
jgi:cellulose synthase/poly-beta-1,6-N-acetylglucosamine synthase-like glycosyltransferase